MEHASGFNRNEFEDPELHTGSCREEVDFFASYTAQAEDDAVENVEDLDHGVLQDGSAIVTSERPGEWVKYRAEDVCGYE